MEPAIVEVASVTDAPPAFDLDNNFEATLAAFKAGAFDGVAPVETPAPETVAVEAPAAEEVATEEPAAPEKQEGDGKQFRLRAKDPRDIAVFAVMKATPGLSYAEAAETIFGKPKAEAATPEAEEESPPAVDTVEHLDAETKRLRVERKAAMAALDFEAVAELDDQLLDLPTRRAAAASRQAQAAVTADTESVADWTAYQEKAATLYPDAAVETSALYQRAEEIIDAMRDNGDPILGKPDSVLRVVQMAAAELGIAPRSTSAAGAVAPKNTNPPAPGPVRMRPTAGSGGNASAPQTAAMALKAIDSMTTEELSAFNRKFGR